MRIAREPISARRMSASEGRVRRGACRDVEFGSQFVCCPRTWTGR